MMNWEFQAALQAITLRAESEMEAALKQMQMMWVFFLIAAFAYVGLAEFMPHHAATLKPEVYWIIFGLALADLAVIVVMRNIYFGKADDVLRTSPNDPSALLRWRQGQLTSMAIASAIVLFGLVLRFIGASRVQAVPLYLLGIAAMVIFKPRAIQ